MKILRSWLSFFLSHLKWIMIVLMLFSLLQFLSYSEEPDVEWEKLFYTEFKYYIWSVQQTLDGGYVIAGSDILGACLIKTDSLGDKKWEKTFSYNDFCDSSGESVDQTSDGGYIIVGMTKLFDELSDQVYLVKTDSLGNREWEKIFGGDNEDTGYSVQQTTDGGYIIVGRSNSFSAGGWNDYDVYLLKTDFQGNLIWEKTFGGEGSEYGFSVQQTLDGGYIIAGATGSYGAGGGDVYLIKTDFTGNLEWEKTFGGNSGDIGRSVQQTSDGGYIIAGVTESYGAGGGDIYLIKTDSNGNKEWEKTYGDKLRDSAYCVRITSDKGYILTGYTVSSSFSEYDIYIIKTDSFGNKEWEKKFDYTANDYGRCGQQTSDGGYILVGNVRLGDGDGFYLIKLGPDKQYPPSNDNFANATVIWGSMGKVTGTNVNATKELGEPNHCGNPGGKSVWYKWQAPSSGPCFFDTYGSTFDTLLAIYSGNAVNSLHHIASNDDDEGSPQSLVSFDVRAESEYNIAIDGKNGDSGNIVLSWILNSVTVTTPYPGDNWLRGTKNNITWATTGSPGSDVRITLWKNNQFYQAITCNTENDGIYQWRIPTFIPIGSDYKVRVTSNSNVKIYDFVNSNFSISHPLKVTSPNGKENWQVGMMKHITWDSSTKIGSSVRITLWKGNQFYTTVTKNTLNSGSYFWTIPKSIPPAPDYRIRITSLQDESVYDFSDDYFTISTLITITSPNGKENWRRGTTKNIIWSTTADINLNIRITLWKGNQYLTTITSKTENDGIYCWTIPKTLPAGSDYKIRITSLQNESMYDFSDDYFSIKFGIIVASPNGGENWRKGITKEITWTSDCGENSYVNITLWKGGTFYLTIINHTPDNGSYSWAISSSVLIGSDYKIRITSTSDSTIFDLSDNYFSITPGVL